VISPRGVSKACFRFLPGFFVLTCGNLPLIACASAAFSFKYSQVSAVLLLFEKSLGSTVSMPPPSALHIICSVTEPLQHVIIAFNEGVAVGKSMLTSVLLSSVKADVACDFECGPVDVARAQVLSLR
jgi:hypothetical protein